MKVEYKILSIKGIHYISNNSIIAEPDAVVGVYVQDPEDAYLIINDNENALRMLNKYLRRQQGTSLIPQTNADGLTKEEYDAEHHDPPEENPE